MKQVKRRKFLQKAGAALTAGVLTVALAVGLMPNNVALAADSLADLDTSDKYTESLGNNASTEYSGRIWTDKSVYDEDATFNVFPDEGQTQKTATIQKGDDEDFLVAFSALGTSQSISGQAQVPADVVFIIDMSGSMRDNDMDDGRTRLANTIDVLNDSIEKLMAMHPETRIGVVAYAGEAITLLELDHYTKLNGNPYFATENNEERILTRAVGTEVGTVNTRTTTSRGTNIQRGVFDGMNMLATEDDTTVVVNGQTVKRVPSVILLSDGAPTIGSTFDSWWDLSQDTADYSYDTERPLYGFQAIMAASYMKEAINRNYGLDSANGTTVYSIGMGINSNLAYVTIDPETHINKNNTDATAIRNAWNTYKEGGVPELHNFEFVHPKDMTFTEGSGRNQKQYTVTAAKDENGNYYDVTDIYYVDQYFDADDSKAVTNVFDSIVSSIMISRPEVPTEIKGDAPIDQTGYITYTDPLGEYMTVKDMKAILYAGQTFTNKTVSTTGNKTTYTFSGEVHSGVYGDQNVNDIIIEVTKDETTGNETVVIKVPASVIPVRVNTVTLNEDGSVKTHTNNGAFPVRVIYSVSLQDGVIDKTTGAVSSKVSAEYIAENMNEDGTVNFYSNLYTGENVVNGHTAGNTTAEFEPSHTNPFYYILEDTPIYVKNANGTYSQVSSATELDDATTYYIYEEYYYGSEKVEEYIARTGAQLKRTALLNKDGHWYRAAGSPRLNRILKFEGTKSYNNTKTASDFYAPTFQYAEGSSDAYAGKFVIYLGNNGVVSYAATGNLEISKDVVIPEGLTPATDEFDFTVSLSATGSYSYIIVDAQGMEVGEGTVADGGKITLADGQTAKISGLPHGTTYEVVEKSYTDKGFKTSDDEDTAGTIEAGKTKVEAFTNTYEVTPAPFPTEGTLGGTKVLTGRDWDSDTFVFILESADVSYPMPDGSVNGVKEVTVTGSYKEDEAVAFEFGKINYDKPGTYVYTISEKMPAEGDYLPGMTYTAAIYRVEVTVVDNGDGTLSATSSLKVFDGTNLQDDDEIEFVNTYSAESTAWVPVGTKHYTDLSGNKPLTAGMFEFKISTTNANAPMPTGTVNGTDGERYYIAKNVGTEIAYPEIVFTHAHAEAENNVYVYTFTEVIPADAKNNGDGTYTLNGMTYDAAVFTVTVTATTDSQKDDVQLTVHYEKYNDGMIRSRVEFANEYDPTDADVVIKGKKVLTGRDVEANEFSFVIEAVTEDAPMPTETTVANATNGTVTFGTITYDKVGTYEYTVKEVKGTLGGVTYDETVWNVKVVVVDNNGVLEATTYYNEVVDSATNDGAVFNNTYVPTFSGEAVNLSGAKHLTGKSLLAGEFYFVVKDIANGTEKVVTHTVDEEHEGGVYHGAIKFLENVTYDKAGTYTYEIYEQIPSNPVTGTTYDESIYRFTVVVTDDKEGNLEVISKKLEVSEDGRATWSLIKEDKVTTDEDDIVNNDIVFTNEYKPMPLSVQVSPMHKVLEGNRATAVEDGEFSFTISANTSDGIQLPAVQTVMNDANGVIKFGNIIFTKAGTYTVKVVENIPDDAVENEDGSFTLDGVRYTAEPITAIYEVTDNRNGTLTARIISSSARTTFTNEYESEGTLELTIKKNFTGRPNHEWLDTDKFEFEVVILDETTQAAVDTGDIVFTEDVSGGTTRVIDEKNETITGNIIFKKAGTYKFVVREVTTNKILGVNYDAQPREVLVVATDNSNGTITAVPTINGVQTDQMIFNNVYEANETDLNGHDNLVVDKQFTGREWLDSDVFTFKLEAVGETKNAVTATNPSVVIAGDTDKDGIVTLDVTTANKAHAHFGNITFKAVGTYEFEVSEVEGSIPGVDYDKSEPKKVVINVVDGGQGVLVATKAATSDSLVFTNTYKADDVSTSLEISKELTGVNWNNHEFTFTITPFEGTAEAIEDGDLILPGTTEETTNVTVTIDASSATVADKAAVRKEILSGIVFKKAGEYGFRITENVGTVNGMQYATTSVVAVIQVTDNPETGKLEATVTYSGTGITENAMFTNVYIPAPVTAVIEAAKELENRTLKAGEFDFRLIGLNGAPMPAKDTVVNTADGKVSFGNITYTEAGTYEYEIREVIMNEDGITYDSSVYKAVVNVTYDTVDGVLTASKPVYLKDNVQVTAAVFKNKYQAKPIEASIEAMKELVGRPLNEGEFEFVLNGLNGAPMPKDTEGNNISTVQNAANGKVSFGKINYTQAGTYKYEITEVQETLGGVTYDAGKVEVTVNVAYDLAEGEFLEPTVTYTKVDVHNNRVEGNTFTNIYAAEGELTLTISKNFTGRENNAWFDTDKFEFEVVILDETTQKAVDAGEVVFPANNGEIVHLVIDAADQDKTITSPEIKFTKAGTYKFVVREVTTNKIPGVTYDAQSREITVTTTDNGNGTITPTYTIADNKILTFVNKYDAKSTDLNGHDNLVVTKNLVGRDWTEDDTFKFKLEVADDEKTQAAVANRIVEFASTELIVTTANKAHAHFGNITFHEVGTYKFKVSEVLPSEADRILGVAYDTTVKYVTINVVDGGHGELVATKDIAQSNELVFTNAYTPEPITATVEVLKELSGRDLNAGEFNFVITAEDGTPMPNVTNVANDVNGKVSFGPIEYDKVGTYEYEITEVIPETKLARVEYDTSKIIATVKVTYDSATGTFNAPEVTYTKVDEAGKQSAGNTFTNVYTPENAKVNLNVHKTLSGRDLAAGEFEFVLKGLGGAPMPQVHTATNAENGTVVFGEIHYNQVGTYEYEITETKGTLGGVTYDGGKVEVTVEVTYDATIGTFNTPVVTYTKVDVNNNAVAGNTFTNTYNTTPGTLHGATDLKVTKSFEGRPGNKWLSTDAFTFIIAGADDVTRNEIGNTITLPENLVITEANKDHAHFGNITFTKAGTYKFTVSEQVGSIDGVTYATTVYEVVVTVVDNGAGQLVVTKTSTDTLVFKNTYSTGTAELPITVVKELMDRNWLETDSFTFELVVRDADTQKAVTEGKVVLPETEVTITGKDTYKQASFGNIIFNVEGTYKFVLHEETGSIPGIHYDSEPREIVVTVVDNNNGTLTVTMASDDMNEDGVFEFTNRYSTKHVEVDGHTQLRVEKVFEGRDEWLSKDVFTFELEATGDTLQYISSEADEQAVVVMHGDAEDGSVDGKVLLEVSKENKELSHFKNIEFHEAGTYTFAVKEVIPAGATDNKYHGVSYDTTEYIITVVVTDDGDGQLDAVTSITKGNDEEVSRMTFNNEYVANGTSADISANKVLEGRKLKEKEFDFTITAVTENAPMPDKATVSNAADGNVTFGSITYTEAGTYTYTVSEVVGSRGGVTYDETVYTVVVTVQDDESGQLVAKVVYKQAGTTVDAMTFTNTYVAEEAEATFEATKNLTGRELAAGEFTFELKDSEGNVLQTVTNDKDGKVTFDTIEYAKVGTYEYKVNEVIPSDDEKVGGVTYDTTVYDVVVVVEDDGNGNLVAYTSIAKGSAEVAKMTFNNIYKANPEDVVITAEKTLTGRELAEGEFTFVLKDVDGNELQTVTNAADGSIIFAPITHDEAGTYKYTVSEMEGTLGGVTYDDTVYEVEVYVTDDGKGQLTAASSIILNHAEVSKIAFANSYKAEGTGVGFVAEKVLDGRELVAGEFEFVLKDAAGNVLQTVKNTEAGMIVFEEIQFTEAGTYTYTISEVNNGLEGVTYDARVYKVVVTVTDGGDGKLVANTSIEVDSAEVAKVIFKNTWVKPIPDPTSIDLNATKVVTPTTGKYNLKAGEFVFHLIAAESNPESDPLKDGVTATNDTIGNIILADNVVYTEAGTYVYTVYEEANGKPGIIYDSAIYTVTVTVTENEANQLVADVAIDKDGKAADAIVFNNGYDPKEATIIIPGLKVLKGKCLHTGEFKFGIRPVTPNAPMPYFTTTTNLATGYFHFGTISYDKVGVYEYEVYEINEGKTGYEYDDTVYRVVVTVTDIADDGALNATINVVGTLGIVFVNEYDPEDTDVEIGGDKILTGRPLTEGEFEFVLMKDGKVIDTATNAADGSFVFDKITYDKPGIYKYTVVEKNTGADRVTYDETVYDVVVVVVDKGGKLVADVQVFAGCKLAELVFNNEYKPEQPPVNPDDPDDPKPPVDPDDPDDPKPPVDPDEPDDPKPPVDPDEPDDPKPPVDPDEPDDPKPPVDPDEPDKPVQPDTGDHNNLVMWFGVLVVAFVGMVQSAVYRRRIR